MHEIRIKNSSFHRELLLHRALKKYSNVQQIAAIESQGCKSSGILDALVNMPHYTLAVFPGPSMKKDIVLKAYARPTIPWSLKCESQGKTRKNLLDSIQFGLKASEPDKASLLFWGIWVMLGMFPNNASPTVI